MHARTRDGGRPVAKRIARRRRRAARLGALPGVRPAARATDDYVAFGASARVLQAGGDRVRSGGPCSPCNGRCTGRSRTPTASGSRPDVRRHAFFALLPYRLGRTLWFVIHLLAIVAAADGAWRTTEDPARRGLAPVAPSLHADGAVWRTGQLTGPCCARPRVVPRSPAATFFRAQTPPPAPPSRHTRGMKPSHRAPVWPALSVSARDDAPMADPRRRLPVGWRSLGDAVVPSRPLLSTVVAMTLHDPPRRSYRRSESGACGSCRTSSLARIAFAASSRAPAPRGFAWATRRATARTRRLVVARRAAEASRWCRSRRHAFRLIYDDRSRP